MVFSGLSHQEKDAFFGLLDEYFQARPDLAASLQGKSSGGNQVDVGKVAGRVASAASAFSNAAPPRRTPGAPSPPSGLVSSQKFGGLDTSSKMNMVASPFTRTKTPPSNVQASVIAAKRNMAAARQAAPEPEPQGEWAEALYDYDSTDAGDLQIRENQRVLVTERTSEDWWTGEFNGKTGLFPASYVKIL